MSSIALTAAVAAVAALIGVWSGNKFGHGHIWDDGTERYEIIPYRIDSDKLGVNRKTVYRCQKEGCPAEETDKKHVKAVDRDTFESAIDDMAAFSSRD